MNIYIEKPLDIYELGERDNQEDSIYPLLDCGDADDHLFILCDGMGGLDCGEIASATVCDALSRYVKKNFVPRSCFTEEQFIHALSFAYDELDKSDNQESTHRMGTTLTFLLIHGGGVIAAHIGDSRIYHIRPSEKKIMWQSRDHSLVQDLVDIGEISKDEMKSHPRRNVITRAMMPHNDRDHADIHQITDIQAGDYFYMCSDGMVETMEDDEIISIFSDNETSDEGKRGMLIDATRNNQDNHSAHIVHIKEVKDSDVPDSKPVMENPSDEEDSQSGIVITNCEAGNKIDKKPKRGFFAKLFGIKK